MNAAQKMAKITADFKAAEAEKERQKYLEIEADRKRAEEYYAKPENLKRYLDKLAQSAQAGYSCCTLDYQDNQWVFALCEALRKEGFRVRSEHWESEYESGSGFNIFVNWGD